MSNIIKMLTVLVLSALLSGCLFTMQPGPGGEEEPVDVCDPVLGDACEPVKPPEDGCFSGRWRLFNRDDVEMTALVRQVEKDWFSVPVRNNANVGVPHGLESGKPDFFRIDLVPAVYSEGQTCGGAPWVTSNQGPWLTQQGEILVPGGTRTFERGNELGSVVQDGVCYNASFTGQVWELEAPDYSDGQDMRDWRVGAPYRTECAE